MAPPILELERVSYAAGPLRILDDITWSVRAHEHWAVLGPNGSGKTTMLRIAAGLLWPNAGGVIRRLGQPLLDLRSLRRSIGWVSQAMLAEIPPQERTLDTVVSGRFAQLGLKRFPGYGPNDDDYDAARLQLQRLRCWHLAQKPFGVLSQGEKQAVLVARAQLAAPLLIVLDESCAGMDPGVRERFLANLASLLEHKDAPSTLFVTHHVEEILPHFERALVLDQGRVAACGATGEVINDRTMSQLYGIHVAQLIHHDGRYWPVFSRPVAADPVADAAACPDGGAIHRGGSGG